MDKAEVCFTSNCIYGFIRVLPGEISDSPFIHQHQLKETKTSTIVQVESGSILGRGPQTGNCRSFKSLGIEVSCDGVSRQQVRILRVCLDQGGLDLECCSNAKNRVGIVPFQVDSFSGQKKLLQLHRSNERNGVQCVKPGKSARIHVNDWVVFDLYRRVPKQVFRLVWLKDQLHSALIKRESNEKTDAMSTVVISINDTDLEATQDMFSFTSQTMNDRDPNTAVCNHASKQTVADDKGATVEEKHDYDFKKSNSSHAKCLSVVKGHSELKESQKTERIEVSDISDSNGTVAAVVREFDTEMNGTTANISSNRSHSLINDPAVCCINEAASYTDVSELLKIHPTVQEFSVVTTRDNFEAGDELVGAGMCNISPPPLDSTATSISLKGESAHRSIGPAGECCEEAIKTSAISTTYYIDPPEMDDLPSFTMPTSRKKTMVNAKWRRMEFNDSDEADVPKFKGNPSAAKTDGLPLAVMDESKTKTMVKVKHRGMKCNGADNAYAPKSKENPSAAEMPLAVNHESKTKTMVKAKRRRMECNGADEAYAPKSMGTPSASEMDGLPPVVKPVSNTTTMAKACNGDVEGDALKSKGNPSAAKMDGLTPFMKLAKQRRENSNREDYHMLLSEFTKDGVMHTPHPLIVIDESTYQKFKDNTVLLSNMRRFNVKTSNCSDGGQTAFSIENCGKNIHHIFNEMNGYSFVDDSSNIPLGLIFFMCRASEECLVCDPSIVFIGDEHKTADYIVLFLFVSDISLFSSMDGIPIWKNLEHFNQLRKGKKSTVKGNKGSHHYGSTGKCFSFGVRNAYKTDAVTKVSLTNYAGDDSTTMRQYKKFIWQNFQAVFAAFDKILTGLSRKLNFSIESMQHLSKNTVLGKYMINAEEIECGAPLLTASINVDCMTRDFHCEKDVTYTTIVVPIQEDTFSSVVFEFLLCDGASFQMCCSQRCCFTYSAYCLTHRQKSTNGMKCMNLSSYSNKSMYCHFRASYKRVKNNSKEK